MEIQNTSIPDVKIFNPRVFKDARGYFFESFRQDFLRQAGIADEFVQDNQSLSQKGILRGLHFQQPPYDQAKLVRVSRGSVLDVVVDIRKNSPHYGQHIAVMLSAENFKQLFVPRGFAHGFVTLEDQTIFEYKCSNYYHAPSESGLMWNDSDLNIDWGVNNPILSEKDEKNKLLRDFDSPFSY